MKHTKLTVGKDRRMKNTFARFRNACKATDALKRYPRKPLDTILEYIRFRKVTPYIPKDATLLDVGTGDGTFLDYLQGHTRFAVGIDPYIAGPSENGNTLRLPGDFPYDYTEDFTFDVSTMLASIDHIPVDEHACIVNGCWKYLNPGGRVIITVPHPRVDRLLELLTSLNILEGFSIQEHYGFNPQWLPDIFNGWKLLKKERWELGCNYLFIFEWSSDRCMCEKIWESQ